MKDREFYEERAAIAEYHGNLSRQEAEKMAMERHELQMQRAGTPNSGNRAPNGQRTGPIDVPDGVV
jgi:hypothetical protein